MLKERLRLWLAETKTSRAELAEKLGVKLRTVEGWLGKKGRQIPLTKTALIEKLIKPANAPGCIAVSVSFTPEQWEELTKDMPEGADKQKLLVERLLAFTRAARLPNE
jgi:transcriptional regulator with XRE-family HTH domain